MGDGRYYTYYQFFCVALITILAIFSISSTVYCYYRNDTKQDIKFSYLAFGFVTFFAILKIVECVIPSIIVANMLRNIELLFLLTSAFCILEFHNIRGNVTAKRMMRASITGVLLVITFNGSFIDQYSFHHVQYSIIYKTVIVLGLMLAVLFSIYSVFRKKQSQYAYNHKISGIMLVLLVLPTAFYVTAALKNCMYIDFIEILIFFSLTVQTNLNLYAGGESGVSSLAFDKIGDLSVNYIFVLDRFGKLIYKNKSTKEANIFKSLEIIDVNNVINIFDGDDVETSKYNGKEYIRMKHNKAKRFFTYKKGLLREGSNEIGYIITITEITELINLLASLEAKRERSKEANKKLEGYSKVVYGLEKEKEINALLEEIIMSSEEQMKHLAQVICDTKHKMDDACFEECIDLAIQKSNEILEEVRETVSAYREYYGG